LPAKRRELILHVPHSSRRIPLEYRRDFLLDEDDLEKELLLMTDAYTDEFSPFLEGARAVVFPVSRLLVDPERFRDDAEEVMSEKGMGAVYTMTHDGRPLKSLVPGRKEELLRRFYDPHHAELASRVRDSLARHGTCLVLDMHSFPSKPLPYEFDQSPDRPDICLGTDPFHTPPSMVEAFKILLEKASFTVKENSPFSGTLVPNPFFGRTRQVHSMMIEINRSLLIEEASGKRLPDCGNVFEAIAGAIKELEERS
jgi:N-formylglutamate amidohydrolase